MEYGPNTIEILAGLDSSQVYNIAGEWNPDDYTSLFSERLIDNISDYYDLPGSSKSQIDAAVTLINDGAKQHEVEFSRTTLNAWMKDERDPSVSSSDQQTRENIYKLCAALNYDWEQTVELFGKVFFTRAFNPKNRKELAYRFFAQRNYKNQIEGSSWYQKGERVIATLLPEDGVQPTKHPITESQYIIDITESMDEVEFTKFLSENQMTFTRKNENAAAREAVKKAALEALKSTPDFERVSGANEIPYDTLIDTILGYTQRNATMATGTISSLRSLPQQLTTNFPTGQILRKICLGEECTYDQVNKMLSLLLFYRFFSGEKGKSNTNNRFKEYLRFSNMILDRAGCTALYPQQPFSGLLLFCATRKNPLLELRMFLSNRIEEEAEAVLQEKLKEAFPNWTNNDCLKVVRSVGRDPFLIEMTIGTLHRPYCGVGERDLINQGEKEELLQFLYDSANFSEQERATLRAFSLLPPSGISDGLVQLIFGEEEMNIIRQLHSYNWINYAKSGWSMDYRIRSTINGQLDFPNRVNCRDFMNAVLSLDPKGLSEKEEKQLCQLRKRVKKL